MVKDHSDRQETHGLLFTISNKGSLYAPSHRQDNTYHGLCYTSRGALAETTNSISQCLKPGVDCSLFVDDLQNCYWSSELLLIFRIATDLLNCYWSSELLLIFRIATDLLNCYWSSELLLIFWIATDLQNCYWSSELLLIFRIATDLQNCYWSSELLLIFWIATDLQNCYWSSELLLIFWIATDLQNCYWSSELLLIFRIATDRPIWVSLNVSCSSVCINVNNGKLKTVLDSLRQRQYVYLPEKMTPFRSTAFSGQKSLIPVVEETKHLRVIFERRLSFVSHLKYVKTNGLKALNGRFDRKFMFHLYGSKLDNGCIVYRSVRRSYLQMLDHVHDQGRRLCLGLELLLWRVYTLMHMNLVWVLDVQSYLCSNLPRPSHFLNIPHMMRCLITNVWSCLMQGQMPSVPLGFAFSGVFLSCFQHWIFRHFENTFIFCVTTLVHHTTMGEQILHVSSLFLVPASAPRLV